MLCNKVETRIFTQENFLSVKWCGIFQLSSTLYATKQNAFFSGVSWPSRSIYMWPTSSSSQFFVNVLSNQPILGVIFTTLLSCSFVSPYPKEILVTKIIFCFPYWHMLIPYIIYSCLNLLLCPLASLLFCHLF